MSMDTDLRLNKDSTKNKKCVSFQTQIAIFILDCPNTTKDQISL